MKKQITTLFALALAQVGVAQTATLYGYAKGEFAFDTRQVIAAREANFIDLATPKGGSNDVANFNGWGIESRLGVKVSGPEFFGMKSDAVIEAHFFGNNGDTNNLGLRHAYVQLSNDDVEILAGQYWHPMFVTNVSPGTYNFNAGSPFQPFNRSPQIRVATKGDVRFIGAVLTERDFISVVHGGGNAAKSGLPTFHAQLQAGDDNSVVGGIGANLKTTKNNYNLVGNGKNLSAWNFLAYAKVNLGGSTNWKVYGNYGHNPSELLQLGGVAYDVANDKLVNDKVLAAWTEFSGNFSPSVEWGVFGGYSKDFGFNKDNFWTNYSAEIAYAQPQGIPVSTWRVSPRVGFKSGNTKLGVELDYTSTTYGYLDNKGKTQKLAQDATGDNLRVSLSLTQTF